MFGFSFTQPKPPPSLRQRHSSDCGPTCLAMVAHYFQTTSSGLADIPAVAHPATAAEMVKMALLVGLSASPCKVALDELARLKGPVILHWTLDHWVVLWAVNSNDYLIDNPAMGRAWVSATEVNRAFSGVVIVCAPRSARYSPTSRQTGDTRHQDLVNHDNRAARNHSKSWMWMFGWAFILATCQLTTPFILKAMIEWVPISQHWGLLAWLVFLFALGQVMAAFTDRLVRQSTMVQLAPEASSDLGAATIHESNKTWKSSPSEQSAASATSNSSLDKDGSYSSLKAREHLDLISSLGDQDRLSVYALIILPIVTIVMGVQWIMTIPLLALDAALITLATRRQARKRRWLSLEEQQKAATLDADREVHWHHRVTQFRPDSTKTLASPRVHMLHALWHTNYRSLQLAGIDDDTQRSVISTIARSLFLGSTVAGYAMGSISIGTFFVLTHYQAIFRMHFENYIRQTLSTASDHVVSESVPTSRPTSLDADQALPRGNRISLTPKRLFPQGIENNGTKSHSESHNTSYNNRKALHSDHLVAWLDTKALPFTIHQALDQRDQLLLFDLAKEISAPDRQFHSHWTICNFELPLTTASVIDQLSIFELEPNIERAWQSLASVGIDQQIRALPYGLNNRVSVTGSPFSQESRARFALAVAIYHSPKILIIDHRKQRFSNAEISELVASASVHATRIIYLSAVEPDKRLFRDRSIQHFEVLEPSVE